MNKKDRKVLFILAIITLGLSLVMFVPFGSSFSSLENLIKFLILPIAIAAINVVITGTKFREYRPTNRFNVLVSYLPIFTYLTSSFVYLAFLLNRADATAVYGYNAYIFLQIFFGLFVAVLILLLSCMDKVNLKLSKNQVNVVDILMYVAFAFDVVVMRDLVTSKYVGLELTNHTAWHTIGCIVIGLVILTSLFYRLNQLYVENEEFVSHDKDELIAKWLQAREDAYYNAELVILYSMYNYTRERVAIKGDEQPSNVIIDESNVVVNADELATIKQQLKELKVQSKENAAKHNKMKEAYAALQGQVKLQVANTELEALKKELSVVTSSIESLQATFDGDNAVYVEEKAQLEEKVNQLAAERAALIAELGLDKPKEEKQKEAPKQVKEEKVFVPSYDEMVKYALSLDNSELSVVPNATGTQHKFLVGKKPYLVMQKTRNDYRITFMADEQGLFEYLKGYPALISVATTPKGGNWLKLANTGELDTEFLKEIIKGSLEAELAQEAAIIAQKEAEKQAKLEAKELEKENREKLREAERIIAKAKREEEKAALKAQKEAEKAAIKAQKEAEKAQEEYEKLLAQNENEENEALEDKKAALEKALNAKENAQKLQEEYEKLVAENQKEEEQAA